MLKHRNYYSARLLRTKLYALLHETPAHRATVYVLFQKDPDYIGAHLIKHMHSF